MIVSYTYLIFCTNHTVALNAAQLALLDSETLVAIVEFCAERCNDYLLTGSNVCSTAYNLHRLSLADVYGCYVHVI